MEGENGFEVAGFHKLNGEGKTKAFCDVSVSGTLLIRGFRVVDGKNGLFVSMPRRQGRDGQWYETVTPLSDEVRGRLSGLVLGAYQEAHD